MGMYLLLYLIYMALGIYLALCLRKLSPRWLMFLAIAYVAYGSIPSVAMVIDSRPLNSPPLELVGQSLLVFFSVVGGALFSSAWNELRAEARNGLNNGG
jgi:hypothetical protein